MSDLVIYFSRSGENYFGGVLKNIEKGNTEVIAEYIQEFTGADLFKVEPAVEYPLDYMECIDVAKKEQQNNARPEIKESLEDISGYDTVYIGFPNWWGTLAPPVRTFVKTGNLEGKTVIPFFTHGGGGMQNCETDMRKFCQAGNAGKVLKAFTCSGNLTGEPIPELEKWAADSLKKAKAGK